MSTETLEAENRALKERLAELERAWNDPDALHANLLRHPKLTEMADKFLHLGGGTGLKQRNAELLAALKGLLPILEAVRYSVGLSKSQLARIDAARKAIAEAEA